MIRKRIAVVSQRYGEEVNGGAEFYAKMLAEHLSKYYMVEVLTTTALDYDTWKPYFKIGTERINGICVRRFGVRHPRRVLWCKILSRIMNKLPKGFQSRLGRHWLEIQGPFCPELVQYIDQHKNDYSSFIFITYLYYTTVAGMMICPEKAILVPTAHDERCIYFPVYRKVFNSPRGIVYLTAAEEQFVERIFKNHKIPHVIAGSGINTPEHLNSTHSLDKYGIQNEYVIYVGRVDKGKGCFQLFDYFIKYKKQHLGLLKLVVIGKIMMDIPKCEDIKCLGFIGEREKYELMSAAKALILPSRFESLSLAVLESMALGVPVIVNGESQVLVEHCLRSQAGYVYRNYKEFVESLIKICIEDEQWRKMAQCAKIYVEENYTWKVTIDKYRTLLEGCIKDEN